MSKNNSSVGKRKQAASQGFSKKPGKNTSAGKRIGKSKPSKANNQLNRRVK